MPETTPGKTDKDGTTRHSPEASLNVYSGDTHHDGEDHGICCKDASLHHLSRCTPESLQMQRMQVELAMNSQMIDCHLMPFDTRR